MRPGYIAASVAMTALFFASVIASRQGWGLQEDAQALAKNRAQSVRVGSVHTRSYYGGGPGFGK